MIEPIEVEDKTLKGAIATALKILGVTRKDVDIQVLSEGQAGLFGKEGAKKTKIRVAVKEKRPKNTI